MAINVICPGCMTRFQVSDKFAGKKGPCPKCGHIIEIPKENIVVHEPESVVSGKKTFKGGDSLRPVSRSTFVFTRNQVLASVAVVLAVVLAAFLCGLFPNGLVKNIIGGIAVFGISFPLTAFGYMMIRDEEDLEIFLGNELYRRSFWVAATLSVVWIGLEVWVYYLNPGVFGIVYLVAAGLLAAFVPMIVFETDFGKGLLIFILFAVSVIFLRGLAYAPDGWFWNQRLRSVRTVLTTEPSAATSENPGATNGENGTVPVPENGDSEASASSPPEPRKPVSIEPPDPRKNLRRR